MVRIAITGGSGKLGRACVRDLLAHGYDVVVLDIVPIDEPAAIFVKTNLDDFGETMQALSQIDGRYDRIDAVVHLAAIPGPTRAPGATIFKTNLISNYNVFEACRRLAIRRVVWASSETVLGLPFDVPPRFVPVDESHGGLPFSSYSLAKHLCEEMAEHYCRWDPELSIVGLRFSNVMAEQDYANVPQFQSDARSRKWNLWAYIDARDGAQAVRKSLQAELTGPNVFVIANDDSIMQRSNADLMAEVFPGVDVPESHRGHQSLLSSEKAKRILGYRPEYGWR